MPELDTPAGLAERATIFGYAIVEHYKAIWAANSPDSPRRAPPYRYTFVPRLYGPDDDVAVTANNDTIYGGCALDLRSEPAILQVPAIHDRYFSIQLISITTDDFAYIGTRATGGDAGTYLIAGPDWRGDTPAGVSAVLRAPSRFAIAPARLAVSGPADLARAAALGGQFVLMPLSQYLGQPAPPRPAPVAWPPFYDPRTGDFEGFLRTISFMLQWHQFGPADRPALDALAALGVRAGQPFDRAALSAEAWPALEAGFAAGRDAIARKADHIGPVVNGWSFSPLIAGHFGTDYLVRSATAWKYIYVQSAQEALYPTADVDSAGLPLDGATGVYALVFPGGGTPPTRFFWSVTIYDKKRGLLVRNPINRYSVGDRTAGLAYDEDGTLRIRIQHGPPPPDQLANWLPAPAEPFYLCLRCYGPEPALLDGAYRIPAVERLD
jgi:hypothetical protein